MATETIYYVDGIPIAFIGGDGVLRVERLSSEDRERIEKTLFSGRSLLD